MQPISEERQKWLHVVLAVFSVLLFKDAGVIATVLQSHIFAHITGLFDISYVVLITLKIKNCFSKAIYDFLASFLEDKEQLPPVQALLPALLLLFLTSHSKALMHVA